MSDNDAKIGAATGENIELTSSRRGRLFVVSGPSGVGKDSLLGRLYQSMSGIQQSVSATTRAPRQGELDGRDYYFLDHAEFETDIEQGYFLEYARYGPDFYGTPRRKVDALRAQGMDVVLKIEVQGAEQIKNLVPDATLIFIMPPNMEEWNAACGCAARTRRGVFWNGLPSRSTKWPTSFATIMRSSTTISKRL